MEKNSNEGLVERAVAREERYKEESGRSERKSKGQFFTPPKIARYMASLIDWNKNGMNKLNILDPGAGTGGLTAAIAESLSATSPPDRAVLDAYEIEDRMVPPLEKTLAECVEELERVGCRANYNIFQKDFILQNSSEIRHGHHDSKDQDRKKYDIAILNPPYFKLNKDSPQARAVENLVYGQPNIYALFMAVSAGVLRPSGQLVSITPRSFCSGSYYEKFRRWLVRNTLLQRIHVFLSRDKVFKSDDVLQENIILKALKMDAGESSKITISSSVDENLKEVNKHNVSSSELYHSKESNCFIRLPSTKAEISVINIVDDWENTLGSLGLEISTGPVVPFRLEEHLEKMPEGREKKAPLLWMQSVQEKGISWPLESKKPQAVSINDESKRVLLPVKNYVLVKRFSSKEQERRLYAHVLDKTQFGEYEMIGIENHLNYIYGQREELSTEEAEGVSATLNTALVDTYFRTLSGHTQVNATEIRTLPLPPKSKIAGIGKRVRNEGLRTGKRLDMLVAEKTGVDKNLINRLYGSSYGKR